MCVLGVLVKVEPSLPLFCIILEGIELLREIEIFSSLPEDVLLWLGDRVSWKELKKGEYLFHEGEATEYMFVIAKGRVKIVKEFPNGKNAIIGMFSTGAMVAEVAAVDGLPYPASAIVLENSTIGFVPSGVFLEMLRKTPDAAIKLIIGLGVKLRKLTDNLGSISTQKVEKRLARFLAKLSQDIGVQKSDGLLLTLPMTRRDLAEIIGTSFEVVERALKKMRENNVISVEGKKILILDFDVLVTISEH